MENKNVLPKPTQTTPNHSIPHQPTPLQANPNQHKIPSKIEDKITTLRVRASTRNLIKGLADIRENSIEDELLFLMQKDNTKQILITVDREKWTTMQNLAKFLKNNGYTKTDRIDDMLMWSLEQTTMNIQKNLEKFNKIDQSTTQQGNAYTSGTGVSSV